MAFSGDYIENGLLFIRNEQKFRLMADLTGFTGSKATYSLIFGIGKIEALNGSWRTITSGGITINMAFKDVPGPGEILSFLGAGYGTYDLYVENIIIPHILKCPGFQDKFVLDSYTIKDISGSIYIVAQNPGPEWNFTAFGSSSVPSGTQVIVNGTTGIYKAGDILFKGSLYIGYYQMIDVNESNLSMQFISEVKAFADASGKAIINLSDEIRPYLTPKIYKGDFYSFYQYEIPHFAKIHLVISDQSALDEYSPDTITIPNHALLAGLPHPKNWASEFKYITETPPDVYLLTNQPNGCRIYPLFIGHYAYLDALDITNRKFGIINKYIETSTTDDELAAFPAGEEDKYYRYIIMRYFYDYRIPKTLGTVREIEIVPNYNPRRYFADSRKLKIDHHPYRWNNFFFFFNNMGGTDLAWLTGKIEVEKQATFLEYSNEFDAFPDASSSNMGQELTSAGQKFRINTGLKTKQEILWLQELIDSELIHWMTKEQYHQWYLLQQDEYPEPIIQPHYYPIKILKDSYKIVDQLETMQSFSFEFIIAAPDPVSLTKISL